MKIFTLVVKLVCALAAIGGTHAQTYPTKPIALVMPYTPGGGTDFLARTVAQRLELRLGQPLVFEYRPGAGLQQHMCRARRPTATPSSMPPARRWRSTSACTSGWPTIR